MAGTFLSRLPQGSAVARPMDEVLYEVLETATAPESAPAAAWARKELMQIGAATTVEELGAEIRAARVMIEKLDSLLRRARPDDPRGREIVWRIERLEARERLFRRALRRHPDYRIEGL